MTLALVRHGEPLSYRDGGLTVAGRAHAERAAAKLAPVLPADGTVVPLVSSPARRCRETARLIREQLGHRGISLSMAAEAPALAMVRVRVTGRLVDLGVARDLAAGLPPEDPAVADLAAFWADHRAGIRPFDAWEAGRYPSFESPAEVRARVVGYLAALHGPVVVVTHSELIRLATGDIGALRAAPPFGEVVLLDTLEPLRGVS